MDVKKVSWDLVTGNNLKIVLTVDRPHKEIWKKDEISIRTLLSDLFIKQDPRELTKNSMGYKDPNLSFAKDRIWSRKNDVNYHLYLGSHSNHYDLKKHCDILGIPVERGFPKALSRYM